MENRAVPARKESVRQLAMIVELMSCILAPEELALAANIGSCHCACLQHVVQRATHFCAPWQAEVVDLTSDSPAPGPSSKRPAAKPAAKPVTQPTAAAPAAKPTAQPTAAAGPAAKKPKKQPGGFALLWVCTHGKARAW